jgi:hypothetical protein
MKIRKLRTKKFYNIGPRRYFEGGCKNWKKIESIKKLQILLIQTYPRPWANFEQQDKTWAKFSTPVACIIKLITSVIYGFRNKLEHLSLNTRLGWKGLPGTNTLAYYGNHKLRP